MKQIVVLSGKGGTGKTSITAALAHLASRENKLVLADADVDAANLEILMNSEKQSEEPFIGGFKAEIHGDRCIGCGRCLEVCRFDAVLRVVEDTGEEVFSIDAVACEGCNSCVHQCPVNAISSYRPVAGTWYISRSPYGLLFHADMNAGEENSGKLVTTVKNAALEECGKSGQTLLLVDGPPGIGCPVIAACAGADLALLSTEPGVSALHDLSRILETVRHFGVTPVVCINRSDINPSKTQEVVEFCSRENIRMLGMIPYDDSVIRAMASGLPVTAFRPDSPASRAIAGIWESLVMIAEVEQIK